MPRPSASILRSFVKVIRLGYHYLLLSPSLAPEESSPFLEMSVPGSAPFSSIIGRNGQSLDQSGGAMSEQQMVKYVRASRIICQNHKSPQLLLHVTL